MDHESEASLRLANAFFAGRRFHALTMAQGFARDVGGLRASQIEVGTNYLEKELRARDDAMLRLILGIDATSLIKAEEKWSVVAPVEQLPLVVPRFAVLPEDVIWDRRVAVKYRKDPAFEVSLGVRRQIAKQFELTGRFVEILAALVAGDETNNDLAREFTVSPNTIKTQLEDIYKKLRVGGKTTSAIKSIREGIIFWIPD